MTKIRGWEKRLTEVIEKHMGLPSAYGISDCYLIADDSVEAVTGSRMYPDAIGYSTELGAARKLKQHGFDTIEEAFAAKFPTVQTSLAQRGDIGIIEHDDKIIAGVFTALGFMTRGANEVIFVPFTDVKSAFKVS